MAYPTLGSPVYDEAGAGTNTWTVPQGSAHGLVGIMQRDSQWGSDNGTWGGLSLTSVAHHTGQSGMSFATWLYYLADLTGKASDQRSSYDQYSDEKSFLDFPVNEAFEYVGKPASPVYKPNRGGYAVESVAFDAGDDDALVFGIASGDHTSDWSINKTLNGNVGTKVLSDYRLWHDIGYAEVFAFEIPGGSGQLTYSAGLHASDAVLSMFAIKLKADIGRKGFFPALVGL